MLLGSLGLAALSLSLGLLTLSLSLDFLALLSVFWRSKVGRRLSFDRRLRMDDVALSGREGAADEGGLIDGGGSLRAQLPPSPPGNSQA